MSTEVNSAPDRQDPFRFGIRRLVLVDSAGFCYVEIPLDRHALLLGAGNLGKSSLLNSLRLFLLPENNFKNSKNKFAFRNASAGSFYTNEESYQHYFPSQYSFLIAEVENPAGIHCQILYREQSSQLSYGRAFAPVAFEQLRPLFWNGDDADGIGQAVPGLCFSKVAETLKKLSRETRFNNDPGKLKTILYNSDLMSRDAVRYSVLPLADPDERKVQSLRTLILLLFEMKADDQAMANAVASIIEADKKFADDAFEFDIDQFLNRHEELKEQKLHLNRIEKERPRFEKLNAAYQRYRALARTQEDFAAFRDGLKIALNAVAQERSAANRERDDIKGSLDQTRARLKDLEKQMNTLEGEIRAQNTTLKRAEQNQRDGELLIAGYGDMSFEDIQATLTEALESDRAQLRALKSAAQAEERKLELARDIEKFENRIARLADRESRQQWQLQHQLDDEVIAPLRAVDNRLVIASPGQALDDKTRATLKEFSRLFASIEGGFEWFDAEYPAKPARQEDYADQRKKLESEVRALQRALSELEQSDDSARDRPRIIARTEKEIQAAEKDLETLRRLPGVATTIEDASEAIDKAKLSLAGEEERHGIEKEKADALESRLARSRGAVERLKEREGELIALNKSVATQQQRVRHLEFVEAEQPMPEENIASARLDDILGQLDELDRLRLTILEHLRQFVFQGIYQDSDGELQKDSPSNTVIRGLVKSLADLFAALDDQNAVLREQIATHNETVASYRQALKSNAEHIGRFETQLNRELEGVVINDLVEIRVDIHTDPKFRNLVEESAGIDPYSDQLQSDAFYDRLRVFVAEFFGEQATSNRLTMDKVITGISYRTRKENATGLDRKGQSTSTTALINLELVHRLLRRVLYPGVGLSFPMVLDELASVDVSQVPSLLERLRHQGFNLFSAATHSASPEVIYQVGRHLEVGQMRTSRPYHPGRSLVFWGGAEGFSSRENLSQWIDQTQDSLLDLADE
jgi:GTPase SAR1 family protein